MNDKPLKDKLEACGKAVEELKGATPFDASIFGKQHRIRVYFDEHQILGVSILRKRPLDKEGIVFILKDLVAALESPSEEVDLKDIL